MRGLIRLACMILVLSAFYCDEKTASFFLPGATSPKTGTLTGLVANGTFPIPGATVALSGIGTRSTTTGSSGIYTMTDLNIGSYTITTTANGFICPAPLVNIQLDLTTTANIACTPVPGSVGGTVRVGNAVQAGIVVTVRDATTNAVVGTATTAANGTYAIPNIAPGNYTATAAPGAGLNFEIDCPNNPRSIVVTTNQNTAANFDCTVKPGTITGRVVFDGKAPPVGTVVTLASGGTTVGTALTLADGTYTASSLSPGGYQLSIAVPSGMVCTNNGQVVVVQSNQTATAATINCTSLPGTITGVVTVDGVPRAGVVINRIGGDFSVIDSARTGPDGRYTMTTPPGTQILVLVNPPNTSCPDAQFVQVVANQTATQDFSCTDTTVFTLSWAGSYRHIAVGSSETCLRMVESPFRTGSTWSTTWTGPGLVGSATRSGSFPSDGVVIDRQAINVIGTYTVDFSIVVPGKPGATGTVTVVVTGSAGTCAAP